MLHILLPLMASAATPEWISVLDGATNGSHISGASQSFGGLGLAMEVGTGDILVIAKVTGNITLPPGALHITDGVNVQVATRFDRNGVVKWARSLTDPNFLSGWCESAALGGPDGHLFSFFRTQIKTVIIPGSNRDQTRNTPV